MPEKTLYHASPAMFRNRPIWFVFCLVAVLYYGLGLVLLSIWWLICKCQRLTVTDRRITMRRGILSKRITEVWHKDVRNVQVSQSIMQRIMNVGQIGVSSSGQGGIEIEISGIRQPMKIKQIIDAAR